MNHNDNSSLTDSWEQRHVNHLEDGSFYSTTTEASQDLEDEYRLTAEEIAVNHRASDMWQYSQSHYETIHVFLDIPQSVRSLLHDITSVRLPVNQEALIQILRSQYPNLEHVFKRYAQPDELPSNVDSASHLVRVAVEINATACSMSPGSPVEEWGERCYIPLLQASKVPGTSAQ